MIVSEKRIAANRANAAKSTGPTTLVGRRNSSRNAIKHGFLSKAAVIHGESQKCFDDLLDSLNQEFDPETPTEVGLVQIMAVTRWQLLRMWTLNSAAIDREIRLQSDAAAQENMRTRASLAMRSLAPDSGRIEMRLSRQHRNALRDLLLLKEKNRPNEATKALRLNENDDK